MDFRVWQAEYSEDLAEIMVRAGAVQLMHAQEVADRVWSALVSQEKLGYGVFRQARPVGFTAGDEVDVRIIRGTCDPECNHGYRDADQGR